MKCPACNVTLVMADRKGIEIDYCPECRGVWLDRGELDKIIEKSNSESSRKTPPGEYAGDRKHYDDDDSKYKYGKKRKSLFGELFDF